MPAVYSAPHRRAVLPISQPYLLEDASRLSEIFSLRTYCWEHSPGREDINSTKYPNGYQDSLEEHSLHFVATDASDNIMAAARLTVCHALEDLAYDFMFQPYRDVIAPDQTFLFYSRLVIHPSYRKRGLSHQFDMARFRKHLALNISTGIVTVNPKRHAQLAPAGFEYIDTLEDPSGTFPFKGLHLLRVHRDSLQDYVTS